MAFISLNTRVAEHRTRLVCLGETPLPRVRCQLAMFTYLLTYALGHLSLPLLLTLSRSLVFALLMAAGVAPEIMYHGLISADSSHPRDVGNVVVIEAVMTENEMVRVHVGVGNRSFCDGEGRHRASETMTADGTSAKRSTACGDRRFPCQATRERRRSHSSAPARVIPASAAACGRLD